MGNAVTLHHPGVHYQTVSHVENITDVCVYVCVWVCAARTWMVHGTRVSGARALRRRFCAAVIITSEILNASAGYCLLGRADKNFHANYRELRPPPARPSRLHGTREIYCLQSTSPRALNLRREGEDREARRRWIRNED